jgi:hypothetical protein
MRKEERGQACFHLHVKGIFGHQSWAGKNSQSQHAYPLLSVRAGPAAQRTISVSRYNKITKILGDIGEAGSAALPALRSFWHDGGMTARALFHFLAPRRRPPPSHRNFDGMNGIYGIMTDGSQTAFPGICPIPLIPFIPSKSLVRRSPYDLITLHNGTFPCPPLPLLNTSR